MHLGHLSVIFRYYIVEENDQGLSQSQVTTEKLTVKMRVYI